MKIEDYYEIRNTIIGFCEKNNLNHEVQEGEHEVDFIMDFGMEAIDLDTLENPTCINAECMLVVYLPHVNDGNTYAKSHYEGVAYGLMETCKPDYLLDVHDGIVTAVAYCVWSDSVAIDEKQLLEKMMQFMLEHGSFVPIPEKLRPSFNTPEGNGKYTFKAVCVLSEIDGEYKADESKLHPVMYAIDTDDDLWNLNIDTIEGNNLMRLYYILKESVKA